MGDIRHAIRLLLRSPAFTIGAVATLALGIGVNSTIFSLARAVLFRPAPGIAAPHQLVWISMVWKDTGRQAGLSYPDYLDYREGSRGVFSDLFAFRQVSMSLGSGGTPERVRGQIVSGSFFPTLGVVPAAGRLLGPIDDVPGAPRAVAVMSERLWRQRFDGDAAVVGRPIVINGRDFIVVGVAAEPFRGATLEDRADIWLPLTVWPVVQTSERALLASRSSSWLSVMGRLRPGVGTAQAQAALSAAAARLAATYREDKDRGVVVAAGTPISPHARSEMLPIAGVLLAVTGLVLIIACANVANLLLARGAARSLELGIRSAIGASRGRLLRQLLAESAVLAVAGTGGGLLLALWAADVLVSMAGPEFAAVRPSADATVLAFTLLVSISSVCVFGLLPALSSTRGVLLPALRQTPTAGGRSRLQGAFVVTQLALSLVLLLAAGLSLRALENWSRIDVGFEARDVYAASYDPVLQNYAADRRVAFRRDLLSRVRALAGVQSATVANLVPLSGIIVGAQVSSAAGDRAEARTQAFINAVAPDYFATLGIPIAQGRPIDANDRPGAPRAIVVNQTLARRLWGTESAIGRTLEMTLRQRATYEVVGVARDAKYDAPTEEPIPFVYTSLEQAPAFDVETLLVKGAGPAMLPAMVAVLRALDQALPVFEVRPMEAIVRERADKERAMGVLFGAFGTLALLLASMGLYGVMAYATARRTREMGVRLALGATPAQLVRLIAADGLRLTLVGTVLGSALALPVARILGALIFGIEAGDVAAFAAACAVLIVVALTAAVLPARRAARVDPILALRAE